MTRFPLRSALLLSLCMAGFSIFLAAQTPDEPKFRPTVKDPFSRPGEVRPTKPTFTAVGYPDFAERNTEWRKKRAAALDAGQPAPPESEKYLVNEIEKVTGLVKTQKGTAVLVKTAQSRTMLLVHEGSVFYNGSLVRIEKTPVREADGKQVIATITCQEIEKNVHDQKEVRTKDLTFYFSSK